MRIIGIELRVKYYDRKAGFQNTEVAVIPCHVDIEASDTLDSYNQVHMNATLHTDRGDITVPDFPIGYINQTAAGIKFRNGAL